MPRWEPDLIHPAGVSAATDKMRADGLPEDAVETFALYETKLREGETGLLPES